MDVGDGRVKTQALLWSYETLQPHVVIRCAVTFHLGVHYPAMRKGIHRIDDRQKKSFDGAQVVTKM